MIAYAELRCRRKEKAVADKLSDEFQGNVGEAKCETKPQGWLYVIALTVDRLSGLFYGGRILTTVSR